ncbi:MAG: hypothetical protein HOO91_12905 [Bacteroidales bacterium]|nr:hypothetical protein [Bacteroidales bacterium]
MKNDKRFFGAFAEYRKMRWDLVAVWVTIDSSSSYESERSTKPINLAESEGPARV